MKVQKLNKELLNLYYKNNKRIYAHKVDDKVYVTDSYRMWILKEKDFILDINKCKATDLTKLFNEDGYETAIKTNELVEMDKCVGVYVTDQINSIRVLVNQKYFDLFENYTLKVKDDKSVLLVYEHDELAGVVTPMKVY